MHNSFLNDLLNKHPDKPNQNEAQNKNAEQIRHETKWVT